MKKNCCIVFLLLVVLHGYSQAWLNVTAFGAKNDSSGKSTAAIAAAIASASAKGGGTVYFPPGKYLTGPIHLQSNITIYIDAGAELHFSDDFDDYLPMVATRFEGVDVTSFSPLFYANGAENISIRGRGKIDGHGKKWWDFVEGYKDNQKRSKWQYIFDSLNKKIVLPDDPRQMQRGFLRPPFIQPMHCKNVLVEGISICNSPFWTINPEFCENVTITGVSINNPHSPNTDGINPESCRYVHISNCHISVGDDCITIKSGKDLPGRTQHAPAEDYTITNCTMLNGHGGVVIGSEMSGGVRNIAISNCIFDGTDRGIRIKTVRGRGGVVEDIRVSNIIMRNIREQAIVLDMEYAKSAEAPVTEKTPAFRNMHFSNITASTKQALLIAGISEMPVRDISITDCVFDAETGMSVSRAANLSFRQVSIHTKTGPALTATECTGLDINDLRTAMPLPGTALVQLNNVQQALIRNCWLQPGSDVFVDLKGNRTNDIIIAGNITDSVKTVLLKSPDITGRVVVR